MTKTSAAPTSTTSQGFQQDYDVEVQLRKEHMHNFFTFGLFSPPLAVRRVNSSGPRFSGDSVHTTYTTPLAGSGAVWASAYVTVAAVTAAVACPGGAPSSGGAHATQATPRAPLAVALDQGGLQ